MSDATVGTRATQGPAEGPVQDPGLGAGQDPTSSGGRYRPRTPWPPFQALLWTIATVLVALVFAGVVGLGGIALGAEVPAVLILGTLVQQLIMITAALWLAGQRGGSRIAVLSLDAPRGGPRSYFYGFATLVVAVMAMSATIHAIDPNLIKADLKQFTDILKSPVWWAMFPMVGIGAPLAEELLFRGFLFSALANSRIGITGAALLTSAGWALVHSYSLVGIAQVFVIGLIFSWMLVRTGSLRVPIIVHGIYNTALTAVMVSGAGKQFFGT